MSMSRMEELDALIEAGWGDSHRIPGDWKSRNPPKSFGPRKVLAKKHRRAAAAHARQVRWDRVRRQEHQMVVEALCWAGRNAPCPAR